MGPRDWLLVKGMRFAMAADPMTENAWLRDVRPSLGDKSLADGKEFTWEAIVEKERTGTRKDGNGGIAMDGGSNHKAGHEPCRVGLYRFEGQ